MRGMTAAGSAVTDPEDRVTRPPLLPPRAAGAGVSAAEGPALAASVASS